MRQGSTQCSWFPQRGKTKVTYGFVVLYTSVRQEFTIAWLQDHPEKNAIRGIFKLGRAGSVSWHQHLCSTSDHFFRRCDNCYQVSARINSFWISLIRSVAAISPETYLRWRFGNASKTSHNFHSGKLKQTASERLKLIIDSPQVVLILRQDRSWMLKGISQDLRRASWKSLSSSWKWTPDTGDRRLVDCQNKIDEKLDAFNHFYHETFSIYL